jgi:hypothetical protein
MNIIFNKPIYKGHLKNLPSDGLPVLAIIQHWYTKGCRYVMVKHVTTDDHDWVIADDDSELSRDWDVVCFAYLSDPNLTVTSLITRDTIFDMKMFDDKNLYSVIEHKIMETTTMSNDEKKMNANGEMVTKEEYIADVKYEMCKLLGLKDGEPCEENANCLNEEPCKKCGRFKGILVKRK